MNASDPVVEPRDGDDDTPDVADSVDVAAPLTPPRENIQAAADRGRRATNPIGIPPRGWKDVTLRVVDQWGADHIGIAAAAVAFYSFLAIIPALAALIAILGLVARGQGATEVIDDLFGALPDEARDVLTDQLDSIAGASSGSLSFTIVITLVLSLWTASGAMSQLINTITIAYDEEETRSWFLRKLMAIGLTFGAIAFTAAAIFSVVALPELIARTGLGVGTRRLLNILIWPGLAISFGVALAILYRIAPDRRRPRWRWVSVGSVFAVVSWIVVTIGFRIYAANFGSYNETYGSLAAAVVLLLWMWMTAVLVLLGAEINAEIESQTANDTTVDGDQPMGERGAQKADVLGELRR